MLVSRGRSSTDEHYRACGLGLGRRYHRQECVDVLQQLNFAKLNGMVDWASRDIDFRHQEIRIDSSSKSQILHARDNGTVLCRPRMFMPRPRNHHTQSTALSVYKHAPQSYTQTIEKQLPLITRLRHHRPRSLCLLSNFRDWRCTLA